MVHICETMLKRPSSQHVLSEVEAWRDDLWLPPAAVEGQKLKRPIDNPVKEFFFILKGEGDGAMPHPKMCGMQAALPSHAEVETYLALSDGDVQAAVDAWADDMDCAPPLSLAFAQVAWLVVLTGSVRAQGRRITSSRPRRWTRSSPAGRAAP